MNKIIISDSISPAIQDWNFRIHLFSTSNPIGLYMSDFPDCCKTVSVPLHHRGDQTLSCYCWKFRVLPVEHLHRVVVLNIVEDISVTLTQSKSKKKPFRNKFGLFVKKILILTVCFVFVSQSSFGPRYILGALPEKFREYYRRQILKCTELSLRA